MFGELSSYKKKKDNPIDSSSPLGILFSIGKLKVNLLYSFLSCKLLVSLLRHFLCAFKSIWRR